MFNEFNNVIDLYNKELEKYKNKPTKASSQRLRNYILQMQKLAIGAKRDLIALDKGE
ncbi:MAG: hypothetical protein IE931_14680 [Sphingobacteriales bacterium]|nr:hypothetical protein [Sphingobacteriales bacterium]